MSNFTKDFSYYLIFIFILSINSCAIQKKNINYSKFSSDWINIWKDKGKIDIEGIYQWTHRSKLYQNGRKHKDVTNTLPEDYAIVKIPDTDNFVLFSSLQDDAVAVITSTVSKKRYIINIAGIRGNFQNFELTVLNKNKLSFTKVDRDPDEKATMEVTLKRLY